jgi:hypothetical protein
MPRLKIIQIQGSVQASIREIMNDIRSSVSKICLGIDDMHLLGNKALVIRAEIYPEKLPLLYVALGANGVKFSPKSLPDISTFQEIKEYPLSLQITSFSDTTDHRVSVPKVPG